MAIIPQQSIFVWKDIDELGDLERLRLVLDYMPDNKLMNKLERERSNGRDDHPVRAMWNSILAGIVYGHISIESLRRELSRNGQLRFMCGFYSSGRKSANAGKINIIPSSAAFTRFLKKLFAYEDDINDIFDKLVEQLREALPDLGKDLAIDSKAIASIANRENKKDTGDGRRDKDANWGRKDYKGNKGDGTAWEKTVSWFGYKLHIIVDTKYELPLEFSVTKASEPDINEAHRLIDNLENNKPDILKRAVSLEADRAYDDTKLIKRLWDEHSIKPVIDIRNMWREPDGTRLLEDYKNVVYNYKGNVYCYCPETGKKREMSVGGFEKDRGALKKLCPAKQYGIECKGNAECAVKHGIRIKLDVDRRIFTPIDRASYKWVREYKKRTSVERVFSRLDESYGFEKHYIRGKTKMKIRCGISLCVMLAMALGRIKENQEDKMRSLIKPA